MWENLTKNLSSFISKNAPALLTGIGVTGVVTTSVLAVRATSQAVRDLQEAESEQTEPLTNIEKVRLTWRYYIPTALSGIATITCVVGAQSLNSKRQTAILSMYALSEKALTEFKTKTEEIVGEKKTKEIKDEVAKEHMMNVPMVNSEVIVTGLGEHKVFDGLSGRYFKSDIETIRRAINDINAQCYNDMYASVNDFYKLIGLPPTLYGDEQGWNMDNRLEIEFSSHLAPDTNEPCLSMEYHGLPKHGYGKIW